MPVTFTTDLPAPSDTHFDASAAAGEVTVLWTDNSDNEDGFRIYRSSDGTSFSQVGSVGANTTSYTDTTYSGDDLWYYVEVYTEHSSSDGGTRTVRFRNPAIYGSTGTISVTRGNLSKSRNSQISGVGAIDATRLKTADRSVTIFGSGTIDTTRTASKSRDVTSHVDTITSFATSDRTSLELIDFDVTYDKSNATWYTDWFQEDRILGDEDTLAVIAYTVDGAKDPAATVYVEYDGSGNGNPDQRSEPVRVGEKGRVHPVSGVPSDTEGYYRLLISEYSGYNSLTNLNIGLVH